MYKWVTVLVAFRVFTTVIKAKFSSHSAPLEEHVQRKYSDLVVKICLRHTINFALSIDVLSAWVNFIAKNHFKMQSMMQST